MALAQDVNLHLACICTGLWRTKKEIAEVEEMALSKERKERKIKLLQMIQLKSGLRLLLKAIDVIIPIMSVMAYFVGIMAVIMMVSEADTTYHLILSKIYAVIGFVICCLNIFIRERLKDSRIVYSFEYTKVIGWFVENAPDLL